MNDIYFDPKYGTLYEAIEEGKSVTFTLDDELGVVKHQFIKRKIPFKINGQNYYDLVTPYGYGGPIIQGCNKCDEAELIFLFEERFKQYCLKHNIVSEFVRFHPIFGNSENFREVYDVQYLRKTIGTTINSQDDPFMTEFSKST